MYITDQDGTKHEVVKTIIHDSNSYEIRNSAVNDKGYLLVEIVAINDMSSCVSKYIEYLHIDDFNEFMLFEKKNIK